MKTKTQTTIQSNERINGATNVSKASEQPMSRALREIEGMEKQGNSAKHRARKTIELVESQETITKAGMERVSCQTVIIRPPVPPTQPLHPSERPQPAQGRSVIKLGMDVDKQRVTIASQYDASAIKPAAAFTPDDLVAWVKARVEEGHVVWTVYEACGFGYTLHWNLVKAGAHSLVIAPIRLDTQRQRKTDGLDARQLCGRLARYLDGQKYELPVIRVPSVAEQQRRETGRQRLFWRSEVHRLASHGRALRLEHEHKGLVGRWWTARNWKKVEAEITPFVREILETIRPQLEYAEKQLQALTRVLQGRALEPIPAGIGALTMAQFDGEICNPHRFSNRKQVGSYIGCCPSVYSSGSTMHMGSIDRHGNKHLRTLLVEAVWRLVGYQPGWLAYRRMLTRMTAGTAMRKKTAVALARQLAIDLWRVRTGRATWQELGFVLK